MSEENKALGRREIEEGFNGTNIDAAHEIYAADFIDHDRAFSWERGRRGGITRFSPVILTMTVSEGVRPTFLGS